MKDARKKTSSKNNPKKSFIKRRTVRKKASTKKKATPKKDSTTYPGQEEEGEEPQTSTHPSQKKEDEKGREGGDELSSLQACVCSCSHEHQGHPLCSALIDCGCSGFTDARDLAVCARLNGHQYNRNNYRHIFDIAQHTPSDDEPRYNVYGLQQVLNFHRLRGITTPTHSIPGKWLDFWSCAPKDWVEYWNYKCKTNWDEYWKLTR